MNQKSSSFPSKKAVKWNNKNPLESLDDFGNSMVKKSINEVKNVNSGMLDQLFGNYEADFGVSKRAQESRVPTRREFKLFSYQEYYENKKIKEEIKQLTNLIKKEVDILKKTDKALLEQVRDVQKLSVDSLPAKPGIYHIRFLEVVLSLLRTIRAKVSESCTWLEAMKTKKKKRGSLFTSLSKKKGTQYSLSSELQTARGVQ